MSRSTARIPSNCTNRSPARSAAPSLTAKPNPANDSRPKDLAAILGVNTNTVLRALRQLRDEGLLEFRRGRGITITGTPDRAPSSNKQELLSYARSQGYKPDELIQIIQQLG